MSYLRTITIGMILCLLSPGCAMLQARDGGRPLTLAEDGHSKYVIVVGDSASPSTRNGAEELQRFLQEISGAQLPIRSDKEPMSEHEIILGANNHLRQLMQTTTALDDLDLGQLGKEGYRIQTVGGHLVIAGGDLRGNLYGVYGLLEDHLGCKWFTPEISRIPKHESLVLPGISETQIPALEYREPYHADCRDGDWCARNRMNSTAAGLEERHGGKVRFGRGMFVHTFNTLVPVEKHFDEHPEYFSEVDGKRIKERTQLCCTNADVIRICTEEMRKRMRDDPDATVFSLSHNDWDNYCECSECQAVAAREESQIGPVLQLVNIVAEAIEDEFPDKAIETLAYQWTRKPPKHMKPRPNVIIRLCSIECCFMHPFDACDSEVNREFLADLEAWPSVSDRLWVWDYTTSHSRYLTPFPNLRVLDDNIRSFVRNNVTGIFEQDVGGTLSSELAGLSGYVIAKLLWDRHYDEDTAINEYLAAVYGKAAQPIREYIDFIHDKVERENIHADIWVDPTNAPYITDELLEKAGEFWDEAEQLAASESDPGVLERVRIARLPIEYSLVERGPVTACMDIYEFDHEHFHVLPSSKPELVEYRDTVKRFFEVAQLAQFSRLGGGEGSISLDQYSSRFQEMLWREPRTLEPLESVQVNTPRPGLEYAYYEGVRAPFRKFEDLDLIKTGTCTGFDVGVRERDEKLAIRFTGHFSASRDGIYSFCSGTNDGVRMLIGPELVIDINAKNRACHKTAGMVALKAGPHPIALEYFQGGGTPKLPISFAGPGFDRRPIDPEALTH